MRQARPILTPAVACNTMANPPMPPILGWTLVLFLAALCLVLVAGAQIATSYATAYVAAPRDLAALLDAVDAASVPAHESHYYSCDDDDTGRLGLDVRAIHRERDALRRHLHRLLRWRADGTAALTPRARLLWAGHRGALEERVRRLDRRRMRFLLGVVAAGAREKTARREGGGDNDKNADDDAAPPLAGDDHHHRRRRRLPIAIAEAIRKPEALRRSTAPAPVSVERMITPPPSPSPSPSHRAGWAGVVQELRASPRMHKRHASVEQSMRSSPPRFGRDVTHSPERRPPLGETGFPPSPRRFGVDLTTHEQRKG